MPRLSQWSDGNVLLIGDAAHAIGPHAGQGGSLALEDAAVLADCLSAEKDIGTALKVYEQRRRRRVDEIAIMTRRRGATKQPASWFGMLVRDLFVRIFVLPATSLPKDPWTLKYGKSGAGEQDE